MENVINVSDPSPFIVQRISGWKPRLMPTAPDLAERAKLAIFWREIESVRAIHTDELTASRASLEDEFSVTLRKALNGSLGSSLSSSARVSYGIWLERAIWSSLSPTFLSSFEKDVDEAYRRALADSLHCTFFHAVAFATCEATLEESVKFKPLLDLWLAGNYPVGLDRAGTFIVLVA